MRLQRNFGYPVALTRFSRRVDGEPKGSTLRQVLVADLARTMCFRPEELRPITRVDKALPAMAPTVQERQCLAADLLDMLRAAKDGY